MPSGVGTVALYAILVIVNSAAVLSDILTPAACRCNTVILGGYSDNSAVPVTWVSSD